MSIFSKARPGRARGAAAFAVLATIAMSLSACGSSNGSTNGDSTAGGSVGSMVLGWSNQAVTMPVYIGVQRGFFKDEGIDATLQNFPSSAEALDAVLTGDVDYAGNGQYTVPPIAVKGGKVKIIGENYTSGKQFGVVCNSDVKKPEDLIGKSASTQVSGSTAYYYHLFTKHYGLDESKINFKDIKYPNLVAALKNGDVDCIFPYEPIVTQALQSVPGSHLLERSGDHDVLILHGMVDVSEKVYSNPKLAEAFLRGLQKSDEWISANIDEAAELYGDQMGVTSEADAKATLSLLDFSVNFNDASVQSLEDVADYMASAGIIKTRPDLKPFIDTSFAEAVFGPSRGK